MTSFHKISKHLYLQVVIHKPAMRLQHPELIWHGEASMLDSNAPWSTVICTASGPACNAHPRLVLSKLHAGSAGGAITSWVSG